MEYNNGVFLILEPGYYRIALHLKSRDNHLVCCIWYTVYKIVKNSREGLIYTSMPVWDAASRMRLPHIMLPISTRLICYH